MGKHKQDTDGQAEAGAIERYRKLQAEGHHTLPYEEYLRAKELGVDLPEAEPVYEVGVAKLDVLKPAAIPVLDGFPLGRCYRLVSRDGNGTERNENAHLLAALGELDEPFIPVRITEDYDGYCWAKLATVEQVEVKVGKRIEWSGLVLHGDLTLTDSIVVTVHTSDGKEHSSPVCMAVLPARRTRPKHNVLVPQVFVTKEARGRIKSTEMLYHMAHGLDRELGYDEHLFCLRWGVACLKEYWKEGKVSW